MGRPARRLAAGSADAIIPGATYRLRVGEYRVFYDVLEGQVNVTAVLHKRETGVALPRGAGMKTMTVFEARNHFSRTLDAAKDDVVIVTRNGKPVAAIQGIDDDDIEDLLLERCERFWEMIARARRGKPIAIDALRRRVEQRPGRGKLSQPRGRAPRRRVT